MPRFYESEEVKNESEKKELKFFYPVLMLVFVYYFLSCGIERIYQPMAYTYGLCGPLQMAPSEAVTVDTTYNGGFLAGRLVSIFVVKFLKPRTMIVASCLLCVSAAILLIAFGSSSATALYIGTGLIGMLTNA